MCEGKCDSNCDGSCDGSCGNGKDKKSVVEMSAESMASMPLEVREEIERLVKVLPDGVRIRVVRSDEITDGLKEEMKEMVKDTVRLLNVGDEESRKQSRRILVLHMLEEICKIGFSLEVLENAGVKPLMCVVPGMKGLDGKESKVNTVFGCGE